MNEIKVHIEKFKKLKGIVIGDLMLDMYSFGNVERISPEAPVPVIKIEKEEARVGGAANVASNLKVMGSDVTVIGLVGDDYNGQKLINLLKEKGIDVSHIMIKKRGKTIVKNRLISKGQQLLRVDHEEDNSLTSHLKSKITEMLKKLQNEANYIIIEDYNKGLMSSGLYREIIKNSNIPVFIDPKFEFYSAMKNAFLVKPNFEEFKRAAKIHRLKGNLLKYMESFRKKLNINHLVVTRGEDGMYVANDNAAYHIPSLHRNVYDVTGAGDMVIATLALSMTSGLDILESSILATITAGIEITKLGAVPVTLEELYEELDRSYLRLKNAVKVLKEQ